MRRLALLWLLLAGSLLATRCGVVLLTGRIELSLTFVAVTALLPGLQAVIVTWLVRAPTTDGGASPWREPASRWSVRGVWLGVVLILVAAALSGRHAAIGPSLGRRLLLLGAGAMLAAAVVRIVWAARGFGSRRRWVRAGPLIGVLALLAGACGVVGLGGQLPLLPSMALVTALGWAVAAVVVAIVTLWAAPVVGRPAAAALEAAAVVALVIAAIVPVLLWLRPYHGAVAWLDPGRVGLLLGAALLLTGALAANGRAAEAREPTQPVTPGAGVSWLVLWVTLLGAVLAAGLVLAGILRSAWVTPSLWWLELLLVPTVQTVVLLGWRQLSLRSAAR